jgi:hypothetical protein
MQVKPTKLSKFFSSPKVLKANQMLISFVHTLQVSGGVFLHAFMYAQMRL